MKNDIIYQLTEEDVQYVANEELERDISPEEIIKIKDAIAENIRWFDAIADAILMEDSIRKE